MAALHQEGPTAAPKAEATDALTKDTAQKDAPTAHRKVAAEVTDTLPITAALQREEAMAAHQRAGTSALQEEERHSVRLTGQGSHTAATEEKAVLKAEASRLQEEGHSAATEQAQEEATASRLEEA